MTPTPPTDEQVITHQARRIVEVERELDIAGASLAQAYRELDHARAMLTQKDGIIASLRGQS